jgi:hypothetical protein
MVFFDTRSALVRTQEYELRTSISWDVDGHLIWDVDGYSRTGRRAALALPRFTISLSLSRAVFLGGLHFLFCFLAAGSALQVLPALLHNVEVS